MEKIDNKIKKLWDNRSKKYKYNIAGVLPKSFPVAVNKAIDDWEYDITKCLIKDITDFNILDIGCGYGRTSKRILTKFKNVRTYGIDIAKNYVDIYNKDLKPRGKALVADMRKLPFRNESVDLVLVVTSLMYILKKKDQRKALSEMFRVLKKGGKLLLIERDIAGYNLITLWGIVGRLRGKKNREITATGFDPKDVLGLIKNSGGTIEQKFGIPFFTFSLPAFFVLNKFGLNKLLKIYLDFVKAVDKFINKIIYPSLYIAYVCSKS